MSGENVSRNQKTSVDLKGFFGRSSQKKLATSVDLCWDAFLALSMRSPLCMRFDFHLQSSLKAQRKRAWSHFLNKMWARTMSCFCLCLLLLLHLPLRCQWKENQTCSSLFRSDSSVRSPFKSFKRISSQATIKIWGALLNFWRSNKLCINKLWLISKPNSSS